MLKKEEAIPWPGTLAIVHSYIAYKAGRKMENNTFVSLSFYHIKNNGRCYFRNWVEWCFLYKRKLKGKNLNH